MKLFYKIDLYMNRIHFNIIEVSSEDEDFKVTELYDLNLKSKVQKLQIGMAN